VRPIDAPKPATRGRPRVAAGARRDAVVYLRCLPEQRDAWQAAADADGRSLSNWASRQLDAAVAAVTRRAAD
jgi:uncharacterized protein (DUF1778 family)